MEGYFVVLVCIVELEYQLYIGKCYLCECMWLVSEDELDDYLLVQFYGQVVSVVLVFWNWWVVVCQLGVIEVQSYDLLLQVIFWGVCIGLLLYYVGCLECNLVVLLQVFDELMWWEVWMSVQLEVENCVEVCVLFDLIEYVFDDWCDWFGC